MTHLLRLNSYISVVVSTFSSQRFIIWIEQLFLFYINNIINARRIVTYFLQIKTHNWFVSTCFLK